MSDPKPQPTHVLVRRLRRAAKALEEIAAARTEGLVLIGRVEKWRAHANTCWQAAGRLDDFDLGLDAREDIQP